MTLTPEQHADLLLELTTPSRYDGWDEPNSFNYIDAEIGQRAATHIRELLAENARLKKRESLYLSETCGVFIVADAEGKLTGSEHACVRYKRALGIAESEVGRLQDDVHRRSKQYNELAEKCDGLRECVNAADEMRKDAYMEDIASDSNHADWQDRPTQIALAYDAARAAIKDQS